MVYDVSFTIPLALHTCSGLLSDWTLFLVLMGLLFFLFSAYILVLIHFAVVVGSRCVDCSDFACR